MSSEDEQSIDPDSHSSSDPPEEKSEALNISRRNLFAGIAGIGVGAVVGGGYALLSQPKQRREVQPTEPVDDGKATLGELHYIIENNGPENARLNISEFVYYRSNDTIKILYETRTDTVEDVPPQRQHVREVGHLTRMYAAYVTQNGTEGTIIHARIANPNEEAKQPDGYYVQSDWVRNYSRGNWTGSRTLNTIFATGYTDEAVQNASTSDSNPS